MDVWLSFTHSLSPPSALLLIVVTDKYISLSVFETNVYYYSLESCKNKETHLLLMFEYNC